MEDKGALDGFTLLLCICSIMVDVCTIPSQLYSDYNDMDLHSRNFYTANNSIHFIEERQQVDAHTIAGDFF